MPRQMLSVVQPRLKVSWRGFNHNCWGEAFRLQLVDDLDTGVVDQRKAMLAGRPDVNVPAFGILEPQPRNRSKQCFDAPHTWKHGASLRVWVKKPNLESFCAHAHGLLDDSFKGAVVAHLFFNLTG